MVDSMLTMITFIFLLCNQMTALNPFIIHPIRRVNQSIRFSAPIVFQSSLLASFHDFRA